MTIRTFIFDFDGTILDTESQDFVVVDEMWKAHDVVLELSEWRKGLGTIGGFNPFDELEARLGRPIDRTHWKAHNHARLLEHCSAQTIRPGVLELFTYAQEHGIPLTGGSSGPRARDHPALCDYCDLERCQQGQTLARDIPDGRGQRQRPARRMLGLRRLGPWGHRSQSGWYALRGSTYPRPRRRLDAPGRSAPAYARRCAARRARRPDHSSTHTYPQLSPRALFYAKPTPVRCTGVGCVRAAAQDMVCPSIVGAPLECR